MYTRATYFNRGYDLRKAHFFRVPNSYKSLFDIFLQSYRFFFRDGFINFVVMSADDENR